MSIQSLAGRVRARFASVVSATFAKQVGESASTVPPAGQLPVRRAAARAVAEMLEGRQLLTGSPYAGTPVGLPGRVQVEDFDLGGEGVGYHDTTAGNTGGAYRTADRVDIESTTDAGGGYAIGTVAPGEWLNYTVDVAAAGSYDLSFRVAVPAFGGTFHLQTEAGANLTGALVVPSTGAWGTYATVTKAGVALAAGVQTLRLSMDAVGGGGANRVGNFNWFAAAASPAPASIAAAAQPGRVVVTWSAPPAGSPAIASYTLYRSTTPGGQGATPYKTGLTAAGYADAAVAQGATYYYTVAAVYAGGVGARSAEASATPDTNRPFAGTPVALPGLLEFENYDLGGEALAYHDTTPTNVSTATNYRPADAVDLSTTSVAGNYAVGAAVTGEWLKYTVDVPATGPYDLTFRLSSKVAGGTFHLEDEAGTNLTGPLTVPNTGDWLTYANVSKLGVPLAAGSHVLKLALDANGAGQATVGNFDSVTVVARPAPTGLAAAAQPGQVALSWSAPPAGGPPVASYNVYRSTTPGGQGGTPYKTGVAGTAYTDAAVAQGTTYYYTVAAVYADGPGFRSAEASAAPDINRPYGGVPAAVPGAVEFENYDVGGEGLAYHDTTAANTSTATAYRPGDGVDLSTTNDAGNYAVGAAAAGEWLKYTVDVPAAGDYDLTFRLSAKVAGGTFHLEDQSGTNLSGPLSVPKTGDWLVYKNLVKSGVPLAAGTQVLRLVLDANGAGQSTVGNFDRVTVRAAAPRNVRVEATGATAAVVRWATIHTAQPVTGYTVRWTRPDGTVASEVQYGPGVTLAATEGLDPETTYDVDVHANFAGGGQSPAGQGPAAADAAPAMPQAALPPAAPGADVRGWYQVTAPGAMARGDAGYANDGRLDLWMTGIVYADDRTQAVYKALEGYAETTEGPYANQPVEFEQNASFQVDPDAGTIGWEDGWDGDNNDNDMNDGKFSGLVVTPVAAPKVWIARDTTLVEGTSGLLTVRRDKAVDLPVTVNLSDKGGTARPGTHYSLSDLSVTIPAGDTTVNFSIDTFANGIVNKTRQAIVGLNGGAGAAHHGYDVPDQVVVTILDDIQNGDGGGGGISIVKPPKSPPPDTDPDDPEDPDSVPTSWVDVSFSWYGWWSTNDDPNQPWYGSNVDRDGDGEGDVVDGLTTGGYLRLNRDYDENFDYDGDDAPPTDLDTDEIVPERDGDLARLWLGGWTDDPSANAAANSQLSLSWDASKVNVWFPTFTEDGSIDGYELKDGSWSESLDQLQNDNSGSPYWWGYWGASALVEGIAASGGLDDVSFEATLSPADGPAVNDTVKATVYDLDLDIDSDNNNGFDVPSRTQKEEWLEGKAGHSGRIILANDGDEDRDGIVDYADGYNRVSDVPADDVAANRFVPLVLSVPPVLSASEDAWIQLSYSSSAPDAVEVGFENPFTPGSGGKLRVWQLDGVEQRLMGEITADGENEDGENEEDGNYVGHQRIPIGKLIDSSGLVTLYVEAVGPSTSVGDLTITATVGIETEDRLYSVAQDSVRLTGVQMTLLSRPVDGDLYGVDPDESEWVVDYALGASDDITEDELDEDSDAPSPGFRVYKYRVSDPRLADQGESQVSVSGNSIPLAGEGATRETAPFAVHFGTPGGHNGFYFAGPDLQISDGDVAVEYNPKKIVRSRLKAARKGYWRDFATKLDEVVNDMRLDPHWRSKPEYTNLSDAAAYGNEIHLRMRALDNGNDRWVGDLYVRMSTGKIEYIGVNPPGQLLGTADVQQIDTVYMSKDSQRFNIGDTWNSDKVDAVVDIKATAAGQLSGNQRERLRALANGKLSTIRPSTLYRGGKWIPNEKYWLQRRAMAFLNLGISESAAAASLSWDDAVVDYERVVALIQFTIEPKMKKGPNGKNIYESVAGGMDQWFADRLELQSRLKDYLNHFAAVNDDLEEALDFINVGLTYATVIKYLNQVSPNN